MEKITGEKSKRFQLKPKSWKYFYMNTTKDFTLYAQNINQSFLAPSIFVRKNNYPTIQHNSIVSYNFTVNGSTFISFLDFPVGGEFPVFRRSPSEDLWFVSVYNHNNNDTNILFWVNTSCPDNCNDHHGECISKFFFFHIFTFLHFFFFCLLENACFCSSYFSGLACEKMVGLSIHFVVLIGIGSFILAVLLFKCVIVLFKKREYDYEDTHKEHFEN